METAIYVRVSTEEQAQEGFSIRGQEQKLKDYARIKEWSIYNIYIDEGISGKNITERPAVNRMIEDIKSGKIKNVVVFKIDRLTRSTADLAYLIELFNSYDCAFNSLMESIDTHTASGRMFIKIIGIFAEFERENISERARLGFERKVKEGYSLCVGHTSYGYNRAKGQKIQTINEKEAEIVQEIFDMYVNQDKTLVGIAKILNIRKIPTKSNKEKSIWRASTIREVLQNCNYIGKVRYAINDKKRNFETEGLHEPIIERELFNEAQKKMSKNKKITSTKKPRTENYYLGFICCPKCGIKLTTHGIYYKNKNGIEIYNCAYKCNNSKLKACDFGNIAHTKVNKAFEDYMEKMANIEEMDDIEIEGKQREKQQIEELLKAYNEKLGKLKNRENEIMNLYIDGNIEFEEYRSMKNKVDTDKKEIESEIDNMDIPEETTPTISKEDIISAFKENWQELTDI
ncbi:MAG: recombinase family protein, partial [Defluviitaleaceae bacterium]|nr:recombinase family protein [Defluviitaleaceae bacterium]